LLGAELVVREFSLLVVVLLEDLPLDILGLFGGEPGFLVF
jgi:hypothetical protein